MMIEHSKSVRMGVTKSLMVVDMPHNTYRNSNEALKNAKKINQKLFALQPIQKILHPLLINIVTLF